MVLATSLVNGFQQVVSQKVFSFWGHIHINEYQPNSSPLTDQAPFPEDDSLVRALKAIPEVSLINAYATKSVILKSRDQIEGVLFKGVTAAYHWKELRPYIISGRVPVFPDSGYSDGILISATIARKLELKAGDRVIIYFIQPGEQAPRPRVLHISGIYKTSIEEYDNTFILGDLRLIRLMNHWDPHMIGGYEIFLKDYRRMDTVNNLIYQQFLPQNLNSVTIKNVYRGIFDWLDLQNNNEIIIIIIMIVVATINMITAILILILERTRMIGVLKSLGMPNRSIQGIFMVHAGYIIGAGILAGNVFGLGLAWLEQTTGFFHLPESIYYVPFAPILIRWGDISLIDLGTFLICLFILFIPSLLIRRIRPVRAIVFR